MTMRSPASSSASCWPGASGRALGGLRMAAGAFWVKARPDGDQVAVAVGRASRPTGLVRSDQALSTALVRRAGGRRRSLQGPSSGRGQERGACRRLVEQAAASAPDELRGPRSISHSPVGDQVAAVARVRGCRASCVHGPDRRWRDQ